MWRRMAAQILQTFFIVFSLTLMNLPTDEATQLMSSSGDGAACPNDPVVFTCTVNGRTSLQWTIVPPPDSALTGRISTPVFGGIGNLPPIGLEGFMFQAAITATSSNSLTSTLTTLTEVSTLNGTTVSCSGDHTESLTIILAESPSSPQSTPIVNEIQNMTSSSLLTLTWSPPSSTGGVSVNYVLTISPPPLSGSPVTVETTTVLITVSYNTPYNLIIRAVNCAGMSSDTVATIPSIVVCPSNPLPANRVTLSDTPPTPALLGSTLSFSCNGQTVSAACESDGQWSPNPSTYQCLPLNCTVPDEPSCGTIVYVVDGVIVNYERLNETVEERSVLIYQCDSGLTLTGPNTITCASAGVWSTDPREIMCTLARTTNAPTAAPLSTSGAIAISVVITFIVTLAIGIFIGLLVMYLCMRKKAVYSPTAEGQANVVPTAPAGPVYEEVALKEEIELNTNEAYGPVTQ